MALIPLCCDVAGSGAELCGWVPWDAEHVGVGGEVGITGEE